MAELERDHRGYHHGERELQRRFDSERLADRLAEVAKHASISPSDRAFIEARDHFFLATADEGGDLDCSYKGGAPGFVRVLDDQTIAFPSYDGNGMYMSAGNILTHNKVGLLFIDWQKGWRMRLNGVASIHLDDPLLAEYPEAQFIVRVRAEEVFPNCPRYIHKMQLVEHSRFVPKAGCETPDHEWKDHFEDVLPEEQQKRRAARRESSA
ncbi:MAG: pyridoxamine 5'-phosphate oxidase family protein [Dehalococcoidia bacterium]|nr:pyridoxamine 5'-phosphate oxidase family protein [Dehalococcoidia bacterium]